MITEFARDFLKKSDVKVVVPGEKEELPPPAAREADAQVEVGNTAKSVRVGEKYEVGNLDFTVLMLLQ